MPLPLYYFLSITAVNILLSWALYLPYRVGHLHFITVANMAISGYTAAWLVMSLHVPFGWALAPGSSWEGSSGGWCRCSSGTPQRSLWSSSDSPSSSSRGRSSRT